MNDQRRLDNIEEKGDFDPSKEKRTLENNRQKGGLNDGNPNTDRTPAIKEDAEQQTGSSSKAGTADS
jgi:hypothetical protein